MACLARSSLLRVPASHPPTPNPSQMNEMTFRDTFVNHKYTAWESMIALHNGGIYAANVIIAEMTIGVLIVREKEGGVKRTAVNSARVF